MKAWSLDGGGEDEEERAGREEREPTRLTRDRDRPTPGTQHRPVQHSLFLPHRWQSYSLPHNWRMYSFTTQLAVILIITQLEKVLFLSLHWFLDAPLTVGSIVGTKHIWHQHSYRSVGSHTHNPIIGSKQYQ